MKELKLKEATLQELSTRISELIGYPLGVDHIHHIEADGTGWFYYIQRLKPGYPVLAMHYRGPLMLALPYQDFRRLCQDEVTVDDYIANSHFNYGYYWGGGGMISGGYWQPLEEGTGIHDTERISRYLKILGCRTHKVSCGYGPSETGCQQCQLDAKTCPFSPLNEMGSWDNEVQEPDRRCELFDAIAARVRADLGFEMIYRLSHNGPKNEVRLRPGWKPDTVKIYANSELLNDLLYYPTEDYDWQKMAQEFTIVIVRDVFDDEMGDYRCESEVLLGEDPDLRQKCLDFWCEKVAKWNKHVDEADESEKSVETIAAEASTTQSGSLRNFIIRIFSRVAGLVR